MATGVLNDVDISEIENQHNATYRGFFPNGSAEYREYRGQEHTDVRAGWLDAWLYADGTLVVPFSRGFEVFDPGIRFTAASPEALDNLLRDGDVANENKEEI